MQKGDILMKKWCFGIGRSRKMVVENNAGEAEVVKHFPRYRTIVMKVLDVKKKGKNTYEAEVLQFASMTAKGKKSKVTFKARNHKIGDREWQTYKVGTQKRPFHQIKMSDTSEEGLPPVGSLVTINKKHAIVTEVGRNSMTIFVKGKYETVVVKPGTVKWHSDKILANALG